MTKLQLERLAYLIVENWARRSERTIYRQAIQAALLASARTGTRPTRASVRTIAMAWLGQRLDLEIGEMLDTEPVPAATTEQRAA